MVQKLNDAGVPPYQIIQVTGQKNVNSLNNYSSVNETQQRDISRTLNPCVRICQCPTLFLYLLLRLQAHFPRHKSQSHVIHALPAQICWLGSSQTIISVEIFMFIWTAAIPNQIQVVLKLSSYIPHPHPHQWRSPSSVLDTFLVTVKVIDFEKISHTCSRFICWRVTDKFTEITSFNVFMAILLCCSSLRTLHVGKKRLDSSNG